MKIPVRVIVMSVCALPVLFMVSRFREVNRKVSPAQGALELRKLIVSAGGEAVVMEACRQTWRKFKPHADECNHQVTEEEFVFVPQTLRNMNYEVIDVLSNYVEVALPPKSGARMAFIAFFDGAPEFGTVQISTNLWYWNYDPSQETREVYQLESEKYRSEYKRNWERRTFKGSFPTRRR